MPAEGEEQPSSPALTRLAAKAASRGLRRAARRLLARALTRDPGYEPAWLWLAAVARDDSERRFCLEQAAKACPDSVAHRDLRRLRRVEACPPPEVAHLAGPPPPPEAVPGRAERFGGRSRWWLVGAAVVVVLALVLGVLQLVRGEEKEPLYVALVAGSRNGALRGEKVVKAVQSHLDHVNEKGGVHGHPVRLLRYDDKAATDPATARATARRVVANGRVMLAIGHFYSDSALAAGPVYAAAGVPLITPTAAVDAATAEPWVFRAIFDDSYQGRFIAAYLRHVLKSQTATVIHDDSTYGRDMASGFTRAFAKLGRVRRDLSIGPRSESATERSRHIDAIVRAVRADPDAGTIVLATEYTPVPPLVLALRTHGVHNPVIGGADLRPDTLSRTLAALQERLPRGPSVTQQLYVVSPQLSDSLTGAGAQWAYSFRRRFGTTPSWAAIAAQTAADAAVHALDRAGVGASTASARDRRAVRDALAAMDSPGRGFSGLYGRVYFDRTRSLRVPANVGVIERGQFVSAPLQLVEYRGDEGELAQERAAGQVVDFDGRVLSLQQVVRTGFNFNRISDLDTRARKFKADFFLWFRYSGDDGVTDVEFANQSDPRYRLPAPIRSRTEGGVKYRLYRVVTTFTADLDFHDYPFDRQHLIVLLQNRTHAASRVLYVGDRAMLSQSQSELLQSGRDPGTSVNDLLNWHIQELALHKDRVGSTASLGDPGVSQAEAGVHYNQYTANFTIARDVGSFLVTSLLPLMLLVIVTYATLLFPRDPNHAPTRVSIQVTAILTAVVLRTTMLNALPDVGYTVAVGWAFYAYFALTVACVFVVLAGAWLMEHRRIAAWRRLTLIARIGFPVYCAAVALVYVLLYG
ncbi:ABC transporter substrate-binding protein [Streptomyces sp. NPDC057743]|uniref:ABC transporter substrate-binding protein n=1 Tax=Streptomyces sp. NPDC057743 TaxID=3346236 RepID=UPI003676A1E6